MSETGVRAGIDHRPGKRLFDIVVSGLALLVLAPLLLTVVMAEWLTGGPALYRQERVTLYGERFEIMKFRTMVVGADRMGANVSPAGDPRVTRLGRFLRRWYLDELPQLCNVLLGDMSLVGPRPETPEFVALLSPDERRVLTVRTGIAGPSTLAFMNEADILAAVPDPVAYYRDTMVHDRVGADLAYLAHRSLAYDIGLLCRQVALIARRVVL
jgi:lipopolysaccharide/colanic/teichoic acid biosynthesis glycosyltransferase